jgi:peptide/nickel transport system ATP-binding protein
LLEIKNLTISFRSGEDKRFAVKNLSLSLKKGRSLGIVGESGSGKSITSLAVMQLLPPQAIMESGNIFFEGQNLVERSFEEMRKIRGNRISMIFQEPMTSLNPVLKCGRQVAEILKIHGKYDKTALKNRVIELFKKVKLPRPEQLYNSYPHQLSGGQKQRVMIAMAIANDPSVLIADEPTTALDVTVQKEILLLLKELRQEYGMSLIFITHDLGVVAEIADEVAVMLKGEIVEYGPVEKILQNPVHPYTKGLMACRPPLDTRPERLPVVDDFLSGDYQEPVPESADKRKKRLQKLFKRKELLKAVDIVTRYPVKRNWYGKPVKWLHAVDKVSFEVFPGETLGLVGESGCGKTTLGRSLLRLIEPYSGRIFFEDVDLLQLRRKEMKKYRRNMNIVFQDPYSSLNPRLTIGQAVMEPMIVHGLYRNNTVRKKKTLELLEKVGLLPEHFYRYPHEFSGGQRQRVVIARALAFQPKFIICDEAVSALDVSVQAKVLNLLNDLKKEFGFTYIFISHDLSVVRYMSDRMMVMKAGRIVEFGDADELFEHPKTEYTRLLLESIPGI